MQFTQSEIAAIVGTKELELIWLRAQLAQAQEALKEKNGNAEPIQLADAA